MPTAGAEKPEGQDASGIGFYFNADDSWHSDSEAPPRAWDPAWIAPPPQDGGTGPASGRRQPRAAPWSASADNPSPAGGGAPRRPAVLAPRPFRRAQPATRSRARPKSPRAGGCNLGPLPRRPAAAWPSRASRSQQLRAPMT